MIANKLIKWSLKPWHLPGRPGAHHRLRAGSRSRLGRPARRHAAIALHGAKSHRHVGLAAGGLGRSPPYPSLSQILNCRVTKQLVTKVVLTSKQRLRSSTKT